MKAVVGVDTQGCYVPVLNLLARLKFPNLHVKLDCVIDPVLPTPAFEFVPSAELSEEYVRAIETAGAEALSIANEKGKLDGLSCETACLTGPAATMLMDDAEETSADLIAVAASRKSALGSLFLGSVSRSLAAHCKQSLLIAKADLAPSGPLTAVFATDHSEYAQRALEKLLQFDPKGLSQVHLVTAFTAGDYVQAVLGSNLGLKGPQVDQFLARELERLSKAAAKKLRDHGIKADHKVQKGQANEVIADAMKDTKADLVIVGAQGHGFIDRLILGSVSFHQVASEPYAVMVIRA